MWSDCSQAPKQYLLHLFYVMPVYVSHFCFCFTCLLILVFFVGFMNWLCIYVHCAFILLILPPLVPVLVPTPAAVPQVGWSSRSAVSSPSWSPEHSEALDGFKTQQQQGELVWTARLVNEGLWQWVELGCFTCRMGS